MFQLERFIEDCRRARHEDENHKAVREVVAEAVSDPSAVAATLGEPQGAGFETLYRADDLTILRFTWAP